MIQKIQFDLELIKEIKLKPEEEISKMIEDNLLISFSHSNSSNRIDVKKSVKLIMSGSSSVIIDNAQSLIELDDSNPGDNGNALFGF